MLDVSATIYETCKAYLLKQGQLLLVLELFIGAFVGAITFSGGTVSDVSRKVVKR